MIDFATRKKELVSAAAERKLAFPPYFDSFKNTDDLEAMSKFVADHKVMMALSPRAHDYNHPNEVFWREYAELAFGELHGAQLLPDSDSRMRKISRAADVVIEMEQKVASYGTDSPAGWIRYGLASKTFEVHPRDQVVIADGNASVRTISRELEKTGQCLPIPPIDDTTTNFARTGPYMSLQSAISLNLPHGLEAQCGSWRDWILGMTVMLADGSIVKSGSQVVKNVAGYDAHKLFVGARGTLGIILEVILKTYPKDALPKHDVEIKRRVPAVARVGYRWPTLWIQRTKPSDFSTAVDNAGDKVMEVDWASSTLWADVPYEDELPRYPNDWVIRRGCRDKNIRLTDPTLIALMKKAKSVFDPQNKFNPGAMGIL